MADIQINDQWEKLKLKIKRKYREINESDLVYTPGNEEQLITSLMQIIKKDRNYVTFMIKKMLLNNDNNRL